MKSITKIFGILLITSFILAGFACQDNNDTNEAENHSEATENKMPLIYQMAYLDRYATKMYLAGMEENWELADIYAHELEEVSEMIIDGNYVDDDINRSELMETILLPQIEQMEEAIDAGNRDMFEENYQVLINSCNQCHSIAEYGLIKVTIPEENPFNQDFSRPEFDN